MQEASASRKERVRRDASRTRTAATCHYSRTTPAPSSTLPIRAQQEVGIGERRLEHGARVGRKRDQEPAGGLRVVGERLRDVVRPSSRHGGSRSRGSDGRRPCARPPRRAPSAPGSAGQRLGVEDRAHAAPRGELVRVTEQPESGHVGHGVRLERPKHVGRVAVQLDASTRPRRRAPRPGRRRRAAPAARCRCRAASSGRERRPARARLRPDPVGMHRADDREPVLRLRVADRVPAREDRPGRAHALVGAREDVARAPRSEAPPGTPRRRARAAASAHREDVVQRVRRGDRAEVRGSSTSGGKKSTVKTMRPARRRAGRPPRRPRGRDRRGDPPRPRGRVPRAASRAARPSTSPRSRPLARARSRATVSTANSMLTDAGETSAAQFDPVLVLRRHGMLAYGRMNRPSAPRADGRAPSRQSP